MFENVILILDLDGVLITTPPWKPDILDNDGYSAFDGVCVQNLNKLLTSNTFEIWLSSSRRKTKTLEAFNKIFSDRKIRQPINGFLPIYEDHLSRKEEIDRFVNSRHQHNYLIIDDNKSLDGLEVRIKKRLIKTDPLTGFNRQKLQEALLLLAS